MTSPGFYFRPGLSVISVAHISAHSPATLRTFIATHLPHVEQLCVVVDDPELLLVAGAAGPKVACRMLAASAPGASEWIRAVHAAAQLADHAWTLWLEPHEVLSRSDYAGLRTVLPHAGRARLAIGHNAAGQPRVRLWRTGWNLAPDGTGQLTPAGPALMRPGLCKMIEQIPVPEADIAGLLSRPPEVQSGPVLVTGMHRSGTSAVAGVLHHLGIALGDQLSGVHTEPHESNEKGHWEDTAGTALDTNALELVQGFVAPWEWVADVSLSELEARKLHVANAQAIVERLALRGRWGFKDPRLCLTLRIWRLVAPNACLILCVRDPLAVAHSLYKRDALPVVDGVRLWRAYYERALETSAAMGVPLLVVDYGELLSALGPQVTRLAAFLGCPDGLDAACRQRIGEFVEARLQHHAPAPALREALEDAYGALSMEGEIDAVLDLYVRLQAAARGSVEAPRSEAQTGTG